MAMQMILLPYEHEYFETPSLLVVVAGAIHESATLQPVQYFQTRRPETYTF